MENNVLRKTLRIQIQGKVQGVYFRKHTRQKAIELGISGYVRNLSNGDVECIVTGEITNLTKFIDWCQQGPVLAKVSHCITEELSLKEFDAFVITA